jgi:hypothetical protein
MPHSSRWHLSLWTVCREREGEGEQLEALFRNQAREPLRSFPAGSFSELLAPSPGRVEMGLVSHDRGRAAGDRSYTLTITDRCSGRLEIVPVSTRAHLVVFVALSRALTHLLLPVPVLPSDSGSESISNEVRRFCDAHGTHFARSRRYHKNNNCYVESKNWTPVRGCARYRRFDIGGHLADVRQLETLLAQRANIPNPCMTLLEKVRIQSRSRKKYDAPLTPLHRLLQAPEATDQAKSQFIRQLKDTSPQL